MVRAISVDIVNFDQETETYKKENDQTGTKARVEYMPLSIDIVPL